MTTLVIAPHPDDEAIGCGGSLLLRAKDGQRTVAVFLTSGELGVPQMAVDDARRLREREATAAASILCLDELVFLRQAEVQAGLDIDATARALRPTLERFVPEIVYVPHMGEWHLDHAAAVPIVREAIRVAAIPAPTLFTYEVWNPLPRCDFAEDITQQMAAKLRAIRTYRSQLTAFRYDHAVRGLNRYRGELNARTRFAEAFAWASASDPGQSGHV